ncbi:HU domain-containing protein [Psychroflexus halocasei]|uniref:Sporulation related domain-containing protein n=1 Tax=Psychroflexus halocasei TaxID=908615 RepID=A0A1H4BKY8_9FLAO|nr:SPOR domain-containing protein [Psychroflexus halocasei]SEA48757.1 Sporulation related domain-containing protein [Psychroflexus halocasei]
MRIEDYIIELLYTHDCVIIPDFGAFLTKRESAVINTEIHHIEPPKRSLQFNAQIKNNDGLLAKHIAFKEKITYQKAVSKMNFFVDDLKLALHEGKVVSLDRLGTFRQDEQISFQADKGQNFLLDAFGLERMTIKAFEKQKTEASRDQNEIKQIKPERQSKTSGYLKYAAIGFIGLGIASILGLSYYETQVETHNIAEQQKAEKILQEEIQEASFSLKSAFQPIIVENEVEENNSQNNKDFKQEISTSKYHVIAGAFRVEANAHKKIKQLKKQNHAATYVGINKYQLHQIAYASFNSRAKANSFLRKIKQENPSAWLLVK